MSQTNQTNQTNQMSQMKIKICGVTTSEDRDLVVDAGADAVGFVSDVSIDTPREVTPERAATLSATVPPFVSSVLVTMPDGVTDALELVEQVRPDTVQVHGLTPKCISNLSSATSVSVMPAVSAGDAPRYESVADALVVDSLDKDGAGGTGSTHDWDRTRDLVTELDIPVVLAGGLTPENVSRAVETVRPYGVDVASGVERQGGVKHPDAVRSFVKRVQRTTHRTRMQA
jgi:phosphoribosylanthranilate isomerase